MLAEEKAVSEKNAMERDNAERDARQNETKVCVSSCPFSDQTFISLYNTKKFSGGQVSRTIELISKLESSANVSFLRPPNQRDFESVCLSECLNVSLTLYFAFSIAATNCITITSDKCATVSRTTS